MRDELTPHGQAIRDELTPHGQAMRDNATVAVIGGGSWGTALAHLLGTSGHAVRLWAFEADIVCQITETRRNPTYLPNTELPVTVTATASLQEALTGTDTVLCVVPTQFIRSVFAEGGRYLSDGAAVVSASKGIEKKTLLTATGILEDVFGKRISIAALSGPSFAKEVVKRAPTAVTLSCANESVGRRLQKIISSPYFRVYAHDDLLGVELGGALKNVMAIAAGISDGLCLGHSTRAALITRGLAEMVRLGVALGADAQTFSGLSGLGDLVLTATGDLSRNRTVGLKLGQGMTIEAILADMRMVAEGVETSRSAYELATRTGVEMPIVEEVYRVIYEGKSPASAVRDLMSRSQKLEFE